MVFLQGCMTHPVLDGPRLLLKAAALAWSIDAGINGPLFSDPLGSAAELPPPTDLTESCTPRPPRPWRLNASAAMSRTASTVCGCTS